MCIALSRVPEGDPANRTYWEPLWSVLRDGLEESKQINVEGPR